MPKVLIGSSKTVTQRNLKIMFWGDTATRKTEEVLRHFPNVFLIDAEGNSDMCADNPDIPEYLFAKTKDPRDALQVIDDIAAGKIKFDDGSPVETLCIDSWSVIWYVQQEFASTMAEKRATRYQQQRRLRSQRDPVRLGSCQAPDEDDHQPHEQLADQVPGAYLPSERPVRRQPGSEQGQEDWLSA